MVNLREPAALSTGTKAMEHGHAQAEADVPHGMNGAAETFDATLVVGGGETPATLDAFLAGVERRAFRVAEITLRQREDALDAVQDAMLRLVSHYRDKPAAEWAPLFWGILRRRIVDLQRRRKVRSIVVGWLGGGRDDDGEELPNWEPADTGPGPLDRMQDAQSWADLARSLRDLPRRQREAFTLRMLEGLDVAETAQAMGCSEGSVKTHLSRAMQRLRKELEDWQ